MPRNTPIKKTSPIDIGDRMGEYQSLRVEAWVEGTKREGETSVSAFKRLFDLVETQANQKASEYKK
jgi:DNA polymerase IIIc chi subunit